MKRWIMIAVGVFALMVVIVVGVGTLLPVDHQAQVSFEVGAPIETVWKLITDVERFSAWRPDVDEVERLPDTNGLPSWNERGSSGTLPLVVEQQEPPHRLVTRIKEGLPFGGTWTYEIRSTDDGSELKITEHGFVDNLFFRFMARFVFGYERTMRTYHDSLAGKFGG